MNTRLELFHLARHLLQVWAFSLTISALQYLFNPERNYEMALVYSMCIGTCTWAAIDLGRFAVGPDPETGWPPGWRGVALTAGGIVAGYLAGMVLGDLWFGCSSWEHLSAQEHRSSIVITLISGTVISSYFYLRGKSHYLEDRVQQVEAQATEARLRLLLTQLEPHMLFNTLANLRVLVGLDPARAQQMLDHLIAYLRATLSASRATEHPLQAEFDRLRDYLELMAVRMGPRLQFDLQLPAPLAQASIPPLLLQPLVENSIRHGLEPQVEGGRIDVIAHTEGDPQHPTLVITVADTGLGLPAEGAASAPPPPTLPSHQHSRGFGLMQIRDRLRTLYGPTSTLELIANTPRGTLARVRFPLKNLP